jgi:hypothetical protein
LEEALAGVASVVAMAVVVEEESAVALVVVRALQTERDGCSWVMGSLLFKKYFAGQLAYGIFLVLLQIVQELYMGIFM